MVNAQPSVNPANNDSLTGVFRHVLGKFLQNVDDMLPARVVAFDRTSNRAQVQPLIAMVSTNGEQISRAPIASVPVFQIGGGGFILNFNLKPNDLGWIKANDRDISLFLQGYDQAAPNTKRKHSFEDCIFYPDVMRGYEINDEDEENAVLQTIDGTQRVSIWADRIKITSDNKIILDAPLTECTGEFISGTNPGYTQTATFYGNINTQLDVTAAGGGVGTPVSLHAHTHNGVQTGGGNTGAPNT